MNQAHIGASQMRKPEVRTNAWGKTQSTYHESIISCLSFTPEVGHPRWMPRNTSIILRLDQMRGNIWGVFIPEMAVNGSMPGCLPMGTTNSPAIACRLGNSGLQQLRKQYKIFQGHPIQNTWRSKLGGFEYIQVVGHGRVLLNKKGQPVALVFSMVDDFFVHAHDQERAGTAFSAFMDQSVWLGFICQPIKTSPPAQVQTLCGMYYDTVAAPKLVIPEMKVSRGITSIDYLIHTNE
jgi:hypothetical protein